VPVVVERPLLDGLGSEPSGRVSSNWEKRGGEGSRRVSDVVGRGESVGSRLFVGDGLVGCSVWLDWGSCCWRLSESSWMTGAWSWVDAMAGRGKTEWGGVAGRTWGPSGDEKRQGVDFIAGT